jgi:hypothetical protein
MKCEGPKCKNRAKYREKEKAWLCDTHAETCSNFDTKRITFMDYVIIACSLPTLLLAAAFDRRT